MEVSLLRSAESSRWSLQRKWASFESCRQPRSTPGSLRL